MRWYLFIAEYNPDDIGKITTGDYDFMRYYLFIAGYNGKTEQVGVAISDDGQHWEISPEPIIPVGKPGSWDAVQTSNPSVLFENGRFRMWYQGVDERNCYRIGYAESDNGWTWQKKPDVMFQRPGLDTIENVPRREGYHQPLVLHDHDRYLMYFSDHCGEPGHIRIAESKDGCTWDVLPDDCLAPLKRWESNGLHYPWVMRENTGFVMWYTSEDYRHHWFLNRAVSEDGIHWRRDPNSHPVIGLETTRRFSAGNYWMPRHLLKFFPNYRHPQVRAAYPDKFKMPEGFPGKMMISLYDRVIFPFRARRFMSFNNSSVVKMPDESYLMYFQSRDENGTLSIGRCTSTDGIRWDNAETDILHAQIQNTGYEWCSVFDADPHLLILEDG